MNVTLSTPQGQKLHCRALVDTGNTVNSHTVITRKLHNQIGTGFSEIGGKAVNTAKTGSGLKKIGISKEITIFLSPLPVFAVLTALPPISENPDPIWLCNFLVITVCEFTVLPVSTKARQWSF